MKILEALGNFIAIFSYILFMGILFFICFPAAFVFSRDRYRHKVIRLEVESVECSPDCAYADHCFDHVFTSEDTRSDGPKHDSVRFPKRLDDY